MFPAAVRISQDLVLRSVRDENDIKRFCSLLTKHLNLVEGLTADCLLRFHPERKLDEFQIVEDTSTGEVVSTSCLFPWLMVYAGVELNSVQIEMIFTHPQYRKMGLVRRQIERLHHIIDARGYDIVILWGIPYYYRQFGYSYCVDGLVTQSLPAWRVEDAPSGRRAPYALRAARAADIPLLESLYPKSVMHLDVYLNRTAEHWRYLLESAKFPVFIVEEVQGGKAVGYLIQVKNKRTIHIFESSLPDQETGLALLQLLKKDYDEILINWPAGGTLAKLAASLGSIVIKSTQWEFRIPSLSNFLMKIAPVLEKRLAGSEFRNIKTDFVLNLFTEAYLIRIEKAKIAQVKPIGFVDTSMGVEGGTLNIPRDAWIRLLLGDGTIDELYGSWPDIVVKPRDKNLVDALFPKMAAYLYTPYHYYGPEIYALEERHLGFYL